MTTSLLRYDAARQALAEARTIDEVRDWEDKAAAVREYARRARNRDMEIDASEIRVRAQRRRGELLAEMKRAGVLVTGPKKQLVVDERPIDRVTLEDLDTTKDESSRSQKLAAIEPDAFERLAARVRKRMQENPEVHAFDVLKERDGPINGARSVMGSRQEPDDSLDYFPTPPWATRALTQIVFPHLGLKPVGLVLEPACGEGHMAEVLEETFDHVDATDIHDYGYGSVVDFLTAKIPADYGDWIISNPPFGEMTEKFVLRSLDLARVGVAMFVRLQWLESVGRYEAVFRDHPPTLLAFFAERVPLCKGRWDPEGSTATAYIWLVWVKGAKPRPPFWIPPGQREKLTRPDDVTRFTTKPVTKRIPHDPLTGEIIDLSARLAEAEHGETDEGGSHVTDRATEPADVQPDTPAAAPSNVVPVPQEVRFGDDDYPDMPEFLRRTE